MKCWLKNKAVGRNDTCKSFTPRARARDGWTCKLCKHFKDGKVKSDTF
jgi:hypothetical protein